MCWERQDEGRCDLLGIYVKKKNLKGFTSDSVVKNTPANAADTGLIPDPGRSHILWSN